MGGKRSSDRDVQISANLRRLRKRAKLTQAAVGKALGVSANQIGKNERGEDKLPAERARAFCELINVPLDELYGELPSEAPTGFAEGDGELYVADDSQAQMVAALVLFVRLVPEPGRTQLIEMIRLVHEELSRPSRRV